MPASIPAPGAWQPATVVAIRDETPTAKTFRLVLAAPSAHLAGQHYVVRLTAPDGYTAARSYSIASAPDGTAEIEVTVERLEDGEVSAFLHDEVMAGDQLEVRGPIGGWFVWRGDHPALLVGGGSGVVPLMAMLRLARQSGQSGHPSDPGARLVVSVRTPADLYYANELSGPDASIIYTRESPPTVPVAHLTVSDLTAALLPDATAYVCGSARFADAASELVLAAGVPADRVRVERFGPTG